MEKRGFIWDFDGTLIDSESHWPSINTKLFARVLDGRTWTKPDHDRIKGHSMENVYAMLVKDYGMTVSFPTFRSAVWEFATHIYEVLAMPMPGAVDALRRAQALNVKMAIGSSNEREVIARTVDRLKLGEFFGVIRSKDDVAPGRTKPHPDIFLRAADAMELKPNECVVFDDAPPGIDAARAAGMYCVAYHSEANEGHDLSAANEHIDHYDQLTHERLASLLR